MPCNLYMSNNFIDFLQSSREGTDVSFRFFEIVLEGTSVSARSPSEEPRPFECRNAEEHGPLPVEALKNPG